MNSENSSQSSSPKLQLSSQLNSAELLDVAHKYAESYLSKEKLGSDEELQLLSCSYTVLFLAAEIGSYPLIAAAHKLIARSHQKVEPVLLAERHHKLAEYYDKGKNV